MNNYDPTDSDVVRALKVLVHTATTRAWLAANDPKALAQAEKARPPT